MMCGTRTGTYGCVRLDMCPVELVVECEPQSHSCCDEVWAAVWSTPLRVELSAMAPDARAPATGTTHRPAGSAHFRVELSYGGVIVVRRDLFENDYQVVHRSRHWGAHLQPERFCLRYASDSGCLSAVAVHGLVKIRSRAPTATERLVGPAFATPALPPFHANVATLRTLQRAICGFGSPA
jgi:hypothetical protein